MFRAITIENFRAFQRFSMEGLGRINLLVGTNNCGKTSVLEAVSILAAWGRPEAISRALIRRGEKSLVPQGEVRWEVEIRHLFPAHEMELNSAFSVQATNDAGSRKLTATLMERTQDAPIEHYLPRSLPQQPNDRLPSQELETVALGQAWLQLRWEGPKPFEQRLSLSASGGIGTESFSRLRLREDAAPPMQFITTEALSRDEIVTHFESIVLTPEEDLVLQALRTIEPSIERLASASEPRFFFTSGERGGLFAKLAGSPQRIPIGSLGDGIWRMLGIALSLAKARGGVLLVDEIDTGLHYSVMADMWRLVRDTAARLDVQVFATTHSRDCYESLAAISRADVGANSDVSIQRIERGKPTAVSFSERDIVIAAERSIEVR